MGQGEGKEEEEKKGAYRIKFARGSRNSPAPTFRSSVAPARVRSVHTHTPIYAETERERERRTYGRTPRIPPSSTLFIFISIVSSSFAYFSLSHLGICALAPSLSLVLFFS